MIHVEGNSPNKHSFGHQEQFTVYIWHYRNRHTYVPVSGETEYRVWVRRYRYR